MSTKDTLMFSRTPKRQRGVSPNDSFSDTTLEGKRLQFFRGVDLGEDIFQPRVQQLMRCSAMTHKAGK